MSLALQHMILAHHGVAEYGSPKSPISIEALILHYADDLDANMAIFAAAIEESGGEGLFTKKHHLLDRRLFRGLKTNEEAADLEPLADQGNSDPFADE
jgi:3'-5' exoribonuclease